MGQLKVIDHPMVKDSLTHLRNRDTKRKKFRHHSDRICEFLFYEAVRNLDLDEVEVDTILAPASGHKLADEVVVVPVLRAGLALLPAALKFLPKSRIGFVGLERDEKTAIAHQYYWKLPDLHENSTVIVTDPMLATGGSIAHVVKAVRKEKPGKIIVVSVIAAPEGVDFLQREFPQIDIVTGALDERLNDDKFIVPGLGDYGDRYFGTDEAEH